MPVLGTASRPRLVSVGGTAGSIPRPQGTYTSSNGAVIVPAGWGRKSWWPYRDPAETTRRRGEVLVFGDSTSYGSGANYSYLQRLRDRHVAAGYADGGKGIVAGLEGAITYDAPEVNGIASLTGFGDTSDNFDVMGGTMLYDNGSVANRTITLQSRGTAFRLWYSKRVTAGQFTYTVDGGSAVTVDAWGTPGQAANFVYVSGLSAGTHTIVVTNLASTPQDAGVKGCWIALAPLNATGLVWQKYARSGQTFNIFNTGWRWPAAFGFQMPAGAAVTANAADYVADTNHPVGGRAAPVLAVMDLGFNDLSNQANTDYSIYLNALSYFDAACRAANIDAVVMSGQLPYNDHWPAWGAGVFNAIKTAAAGYGMAFVDFFYPVAGPSLSYASGTTNPHLTKAQYVAQADFLWDNLLGL